MSVVVSTFSEARQVLETYRPYRVTERHAYALTYMHELMDFLGNPQDTLRVIHVAGTSGKTSTAYYAAALLHSAGKKVGLTVSPHVDEVNERVQIDMVPLPERVFCQELSEFLTIVESSGIQATYFELLIAFAYWEFARAQVEYAVVEVGLGGLLDGTNVVSRQDKVCVITDIGLDHMNILGTTLPEIAAQKAGIIGLHNSVFCYEQSEPVDTVIRHRARQKQADLHMLRTRVARPELDFLPLFQQRNLGLAAAAARWVLKRYEGKNLTKRMLLQAAHTPIPARMEVIAHGAQTIIVDGSHNAQKLHALTQSMQHRFNKQPVAALVSIAASRDFRIEDATKEMAALAQHIIVTTFHDPKDGPHHSEDAGMIAAACKRHGAQSVEVIPDPQTALQALLARPEPVLVVTGSFYLLNHIRPLLRQIP